MMIIVFEFEKKLFVWFGSFFFSRYMHWLYCTSHVTFYSLILMRKLQVVLKVFTCSVIFKTFLNRKRRKRWSFTWKSNKEENSIIIFSLVLIVSFNNLRLFTQNIIYHLDSSSSPKNFLYAHLYLYCCYYYPP